MWARGTLALVSWCGWAANTLLELLEARCGRGVLALSEFIPSTEHSQFERCLSTDSLHKVVVIEALSTLAIDVNKFVIDFELAISKTSSSDSRNEVLASRYTYVNKKLAK